MWEIINPTVSSCPLLCACTVAQQKELRTTLNLTFPVHPHLHTTLHTTTRVSQPCNTHVWTHFSNGELSEVEMPGSATCLKQMLLNDPSAPSFLKSNRVAFSTTPGTEDASSIWINSSKWVTKCFCSVLKPIWLLCFLAAFLYNKNCLTCSETHWPSFFRGLTIIHPRVCVTRDADGQLEA